jgi:hypothetical protein
MKWIDEILNDHSIVGITSVNLRYENDGTQRDVTRSKITDVEEWLWDSTKNNQVAIKAT